MTKPGAKLPYEDTRLAQFLRKRIDEMASEMSQREIAAEIGYDKPNIISMFKRGDAKVPLDRIPAFARALRVDPVQLLKLSLEQQLPEDAKEVRGFFEGIATANGREWLDMLVEASGENDPKLTPERAQRLREVFRS